MRKLLATAVLAAIVVTGCGSSSSKTAAASATTTKAAAAFPVTVGSVTLATKPTHIVSLSPTATEMLYAVGAGSQVTAVDIYSTYPPEAPHSKLNGYDSSAEAVAAEHPDLVLLASDSGGKLAPGLAALKIPALLLPAATTLDDTYAQIAEVGKITGHGAEATAEVAKVKGQVAAVVKSVGDKAKGKTYYHELDNTLYTATSHTFIGQVYSLLGMVDIADAAPSKTAGDYPQISAEFLVQKNPDFVFLADTTCCQQTAATFAARPAFGQLEAVKAGHVVPVSDDIASHWGPRIVDFLKIVADAVTK